MSHDSSLPDDRDKMEGTVYTSFNIENHDELGLTHNDLLFVALLAGGDYAVCDSFLMLI